MIHILTTGGTIEGLDYVDDKGITESNITINGFLKNANITFDYIIDNVFKKDSRFIDVKDRNILASKIESSNASKILITHGTYTMEDTAQYLGKLNLKKTIVLVGSFILGSENNTDASFNLGYAVSALQHLNNGVYVAMNGQIFNWDNVTKNLKDNKFERKYE